MLTFASLPVYWLLVRRAQHLGLALASSLGMTVYTVVLFVLLNRRTHNRARRRDDAVFRSRCAPHPPRSPGPATGWKFFSSRTSPGSDSRAPYCCFRVVTAAGILLLLVLGKLLRIRELEEQIARLWLLAGGDRAKPVI